MIVMHLYGCSSGVFVMRYRTEERNELLEQSTVYGGVIQIRSIRVNECCMAVVAAIAKTHRVASFVGNN